MSRRMSETTKWQFPEFRAMPLKMKVFWFFINDNCDFAGVWVKDFQTASHFINEPVTEDEVRHFWGHKFVFLPKKVFIPSFLLVQYGQFPKDTQHRVHRSVVKLLWEHGIDYGNLPVPNVIEHIDTLSIPLRNP